MSFGGKEQTLKRLWLKNPIKKIKMPKSPTYVKKCSLTSASGFFLEKVQNWLCFEILRTAQGCQIFLGATYQNGKNIPNNHKIYHITIKYTKCQWNIPNNHKIYQMASKFTKEPQIDQMDI
jgi:hypothetical protein